MMIKLGVLLSGSGTTFQNLLDLSQRKELDAEVVCVIASRDDAYGLERARQADIPAVALPRKDYPDPQHHSDAVWAELRKHEADLVVLAGYMSLISVPPDYANRIMNVHPSLIPAFCGQGMYGYRVHEAGIDYGAKISGATVHFVDEHYDNGPIILQEAVPVF